MYLTPRHADINLTSVAVVCIVNLVIPTTYRKDINMATYTLDAYDPSGRLIAKCSPNDYGSALLMSLHGEGSTIRCKGRILWLEGADGEGAESYDTTLSTCLDRLDK